MRSDAAQLAYDALQREAAAHMALPEEDRRRLAAERTDADKRRDIVRMIRRRSGRNAQA